jgi:two-component system sensor histidine kinase MprB
MSLRGRLTLLATVAVTIGIGSAVGFTYLAFRHELLEDLQTQLKRQSQNVAPYVERFMDGQHARGYVTPGRSRLHTRRRFGDMNNIIQVITPTGDVTYHRTDSSVTTNLPVTAADRSIALHQSGTSLHNVTLDGQAVRIMTVPVRADGRKLALQVALPLGDVNHQLAVLRLELLAACAAGMALAAGLGFLVTRAALRPIGTLTEAAERIAATKDLAHRISEDRAAGHRDEVNRLSVSFNAMLDAVQAATVTQRQLVADASHELRTPLTSLRTNIEVLARADELSPEDRGELISSVLYGLDELTGLVADTVELARGEEPTTAEDELRWDVLLGRAVTRARRHWSPITFELTADSVLVRGVSSRLERAIGNLLDNAAKFSPPGGRVEVTLRYATPPDDVSVTRPAAVLTVRDHGPGIRDADLPHVFDRFYRAADARSRPGSGLGLAIVKQVADGHHGAVRASNAPDGGAVLRLWLPTDELS